jgi:hypothetical protein
MKFKTKNLIHTLVNEPTMKHVTDDIPENGQVRLKHVLIMRTSERNMTVLQ